MCCGMPSDGFFLFHYHFSYLVWVVKQNNTITTSKFSNVVVDLYWKKKTKQTNKNFSQRDSQVTQGQFIQPWKF